MASKSPLQNFLLGCLACPDGQGSEAPQCSREMIARAADADADALK